MNDTILQSLCFTRDRISPKVLSIIYTIFKVILRRLGRNKKGQGKKKKITDNIRAKLKNRMIRMRNTCY